MDRAEIIDKIGFHLQQTYALAGELSRRHNLLATMGAVTKTGVPLVVIEGGRDQLEVIKKRN